MQLIFAVGFCEVVNERMALDGRRVSSGSDNNALAVIILFAFRPIGAASKGWDVPCTGTADPVNIQPICCPEQWQITVVHE
jgi:hypothetical protein